MKIGDKINTSCDDDHVFVEQKNEDGSITCWKLNYDQAIKVMASWWEMIGADGINVAAQIQKQRSQIKGDKDGR